MRAKSHLLTEDQAQISMGIEEFPQYRKLFVDVFRPILTLNVLAGLMIVERITLHPKPFEMIENGGSEQETGLIDRLKKCSLSISAGSVLTLFECLPCPARQRGRSENVGKPVSRGEVDFVPIIENLDAECQFAEISLPL